MTIDQLSDDPIRWAALDAAIPGGLRRRGDSGWDESRQSFNGTIDRHPAAIVSCSSAADVAVAVRHAREAGLSIAGRLIGRLTGRLPGSRLSRCRWSRRR